MCEQIAGAVLDTFAKRRPATDLPPDHAAWMSPLHRAYHRGCGTGTEMGDDFAGKPLPRGPINWKDIRPSAPLSPPDPVEEPAS